VTDASLVLGFLDPGYFAGGSVSLDSGRARAAIEQHIATPLDLSVEQAAHGIHRVVNAQMAEGMRLVSIQQGFDPRDFALVPLGGAGPVHALPLAAELGIDTVLVPRHPGVLSAAGLLLAPIEHEMSVGLPKDLDDIDRQELCAPLARLDAQCAELMSAEDVTPAQVRISHAADVCYVGQSHYLEVSVDLAAPDPLQAIYQSFVAMHEQIFGYSTASPARLVNLRSVHQAGGGTAATGSAPARAHDGRADASRAVIFDDPVMPLATPVLDRATLGPGQEVTGPAIIEQPDTTTIVHPGWRATVLDDGSLRLLACSRQRLRS
jgi:N-methylhydantoinase A/oxoprolinase/acetone carboxylase beta subunit